MMGLFGEIAKVKAMNSGSYVKPGHYMARIDNVKSQKNRRQGDYVAIEMTCLHTFPDGEVPSDGSGHHRPGESMSDVISNKNDMFLPKVKSFVAKVTGDESKIDEAFVDFVMGPDQPFKGLPVEVIGKTIVTKGNKISITQVSYLGQVRAARIAEIVSPEILASQFPGDTLELLQRKQQEVFGLN